MKAVEDINQTRDIFILKEKHVFSTKMMYYASQDYLFYW